MAQISLNAALLRARRYYAKLNPHYPYKVYRPRSLNARLNCGVIVLHSCENGFITDGWHTEDFRDHLVELKLMRGDEFIKAKA